MIIPIGFNVITQMFDRILSSDFLYDPPKSRREFSFEKEYIKQLKKVKTDIYVRPKPFSQWGEYE